MTQTPAISAQQKNQLRRSFRKDLKSPVRLWLFTQAPSPIAIPGRECPTCPQTQQLIEEVASASPKIDLQVYDFYSEPSLVKELGVERIPALLIGSDDTPRMKFYGAPLGYQMAAIIESIRSLSRGTSPLANDVRRRLRQVDRPVHVQVIVSPEEQSGAEVAFTAFAMARENRHISVDAIQIRDYPALARNLGVQSLPLALVNDLYRVTSPVTERKLAEQVIAAGGGENS